MEPAGVPPVSGVGLPLEPGNPTATQGTAGAEKPTPGVAGVIPLQGKCPLPPTQGDVIRSAQRHRPLRSGLPPANSGYFRDPIGIAAGRKNDTASG